MKKLIASVLALTIFAILLSDLAIAAGNTPDESYWIGYCNTGTWAKIEPPVNLKNPNVGFLFQVMDGAKVVNVCCGQHTLPTGNVDPKQQRCAVFGAERGDCKKGTEIAYCTGTTPFKVCCPDGQAPTCDPDATKQQCVQNPFGKITDGMACGPADTTTVVSIPLPDPGAL